ncbi:MAG: TetR/AcrR family transcriptional regulator [Parvibaculum sp.]|uniref:TetR/AcrR family transcriptional regulator n=1 Tax=Parvibaculum sp. TaxID=2024848 RepID=UPI002729017D|nr:TetR/AcrR family transcriptional regulator [Parvibaculum sp.]MDO8839921.1 TetR/AcrR family transcriptional regulator [Parvibaculum sp.]
MEGGLRLGLENYRRTISETKHAAILNAARENFLKGGYSRAAMAEIARDADVSTATLYKHFASKEALFTAVVEAVYDNMNAPTLGNIEGATARDALTKICNVYAAQQFEGQMNGMLRIVIAEVPSSPELARKVFERGVSARYKQFQQVLDALVKRGDFKPHDTETGVRMLGGMVKEFIVWPALFIREFQRPNDIDSKIESCVDAYFRMYERIQR